MSLDNSQSSYKSTAEAQSAINKTIDELSELAAKAHAVKQGYIAQAHITKDIAKAEWRLTTKSLVIAAALVVCLGSGFILMWGSILLLLGYLLFKLTASVTISAIILLVLQGVSLFLCTRALTQVIRHIGFDKTFKQIKRLLFLNRSKKNAH